MKRHIRLLGTLVPLIGAVAFPIAASSATKGVPIPIADSSMKASFTTVGGVAPLATDRTVAHFAGSSVDPTNGVRYRYNMVGADPFNCSGAACSTTIQVDIVPVTVNLAGWTFTADQGTVAATLNSPQFATNDYGSTPNATVPGDGTTTYDVRGPGGALSGGDAGVSLQLQDATMRAQFNLTGANSPYHLILQPNVLPGVTINVPQNQGTLLQSGRGVVFADVDNGWWSSQINNLQAQANETHLVLFLTRDVFTYTNNNYQYCCILGFHGAKARSSNGNGSQKVQTFAWASYVSPGLYSHADGGSNWALQDIHALSHEIAEWADDPYVNNSVQPWLTPTAPQYGCSLALETGDPVVDIGFAMGTNTYLQGANPNGSQSADGYYHPEDEALAPWFLRQSPSWAEPTQSASSYTGRFTLMGDLNPYPGFRAPATGC